MDQTHEPPYIAPAGFGVSLISHVRSLLWTDGMLQQGYEQHPGGIFKMPAMGGWVTIVSGKYLDEVLRAPEATLSFHEKLNDILQLEHLIGPQMSQDQIHLPLIKILNRNIDLVHAEIADETPFAIELELSKAAMTDGWTEVKCFETAYNCVLRLNLRAFMGLPLCLF